MKEKIKQIVEAMGFKFFEGDIYNVNQALKKFKQFPAVLYISPISGGGEITMAGMVKKRIEPLLMFVDHDKLDPDGTETNTVIERMRQAAETFVLKLNESREFEPIASWTVRDIIKDMNYRCSGVSLQLTITESRGVCK